MGGRGGSGDQTTEKRYAPYIESKHEDFLNATVANRVLNDAPDYTVTEANDAFLGVGYALSNFPSLYDMYGKFMAGFDIEVLWSSVFENKLNKSEINTDVTAEIKLADEKMVKGELADFQLNMRSVNAVPTSSFVMGRAVLEDKRIKAIAKIRLDAKTKLIPEIGLEFATHLNWGKKTITTYANIMKNYFLYKIDQDDANYTFESRTTLWPFTSLAFEGAALGTMQGVTSFKKTMSPRERSTISKVLLVSSYTVSGGYLGASFGPHGAIISAAIGFVIGLAMVFLE